MSFYSLVPLVPNQNLALKALKQHGIKPDTKDGNPCHYMAFDPGKVTGFATFAENGRPTGMGHIPNWADGVKKFLEVYPEEVPAVIIYEDYTIRGRAQNVDENVIYTRAVIKAIKEIGKDYGSKLIPQQASILPVAQKWSGMAMPRDHSKSHQISAFNHGWYKLQVDGIVVPRIKWPEG